MLELSQYVKKKEWPVPKGKKHIGIKKQNPINIFMWGVLDDG